MLARRPARKYSHVRLACTAVEEAPFRSGLTSHAERLANPQKSRATPVGGALRQWRTSSAGPHETEQEHAWPPGRAMTATWGRPESTKPVSRDKRLGALGPGGWWSLPHLYARVRSRRSLRHVDCAGANRGSVVREPQATGAKSCVMAAIRDRSLPLAAAASERPRGRSQPSLKMHLRWRTTFTRFPLDVTIRSGNPSTEGRSCTSGCNPRSERPTSVPSWAEAC